MGNLVGPDDGMEGSSMIAQRYPLNGRNFPENNLEPEESEPAQDPDDYDPILEERYQEEKDAHSATVRVPESRRDRQAVESDGKRSCAGSETRKGALSVL
jgi:hypothetical protein